MVDNHPYTVDHDSRGKRFWEMVTAMDKSTHMIEETGFSAQNPAEAKHIVAVRRMILIGLSAAMALATLAPVVVLAAG